jgi:hypothetical protein
MKTMKTITFSGHKLCGEDYDIFAKFKGYN